MQILPFHIKIITHGDLTFDFKMAEANIYNYQAIITKILKKSGPPEGRYGCTLWQGAKCNSGRYGQIRNPLKGLDHQPSTTTVHRLLFLLHNIHKFGHLLPSTDEHGVVLHVSHRCHHSLCTNIHHLTLEKQPINYERNACMTQGHCIGTHDPPCLL